MKDIMRIRIDFIDGYIDIDRHELQKLEKAQAAIELLERANRLYIHLNRLFKDKK